MSKRFIVYLAMLLTIINLTILGVIIYHHWMVPEPERQLTGFERVKQAVEPTPDQLEQMQELRRSFHTELDSLEILLTGERRQLAEEIRSAEPDSAEMRRLINRIGRLQQESQHRIIRNFMEIREILTPAQRERFFDIVLERFVSRQQFPGQNRMRQSPDGQ